MTWHARSRLTALVLAQLLLLTQLVLAGSLADEIKSWSPHAGPLLKDGPGPFPDLVIMDSRMPKELASSQETISSLKAKTKKLIAQLDLRVMVSTSPLWQPSWTVGNPSFIQGEMERLPTGDVLYALDCYAPEFRSVLFGSPTALLDDLISRGFDGVALTGLEGPQTDASMSAALLKDIRSYCQEKKPGFAVLLMGMMPEMLSPTVFDAIDGLIMMGSIFGPEGKRPQFVLDRLKKTIQEAKDKGLLVLSLDATKDESQRQEAASWAQETGALSFSIASDEGPPGARGPHGPPGPPPPGAQPPEGGPPPDVAAPAAPPPLPTPGPPPQRPPTKDWILWTIVGVGLVAILLAAVLK